MLGCQTMIYDGLPTEVTSIYYESDMNIFIDQEGEYDVEVFKLIPPHRLRFLKEVGGTEYVDYNGGIYEFEFPIGEEDE